MARYGRIAFIISSGDASRQARAFPAKATHASPTSSSVIWFVIFVNRSRAMSVFHSPASFGKQIIHVAGNEPGARQCLLPADTHSVEAALCHEIAVRSTKMRLMISDSSPCRISLFIPQLRREDISRAAASEFCIPSARMMAGQGKSL